MFGAPVMVNHGGTTPSHPERSEGGMRLVMPPSLRSG
jgi:hypothetical protein